MILETQEQQVRYVTNYLENRFQVLTNDGKYEDAASVYEELFCQDYVDDETSEVDSVFSDGSWIFLVVEGV
jgi:hypothetical protein